VEDAEARIRAIEHLVVLLASTLPPEALTAIADKVLPMHQAANPPEEWRRHLERLVEAAVSLRPGS
jgi:hypothetical protein